MGSQPQPAPTRLADLEPTIFPDLTGLSPSARKSRTGHADATHQLHLSNRDLKKAQQDFGIAAEILIFAAWTKVLSAYLGDSSICAGLIRQNTKSGTHRNPRTSKITLASSLDASNTNTDLLKDLDDQLHASGTQAEDCNAESLADSYIELCNSAGGLDTSPQLPSLDGTATLLRIQNDSDNQGLHASLMFRRSLILEEDTHFVFSAFEDALASIIHSPSSSVQSWAQTLQKTTQSISNASYSSTKPEHGETIQSSIEYHAQHHPEHIALDFLETNGDRVKWTFRQLHNLGARIADVLISENGVQLEDSIPVCVPKSPAFYACILGVMMSGAAFTPFSGSPEDRKRFMLEELGSKVVLCVDGEDMSWCQSAEVVNISALIAKPDDLPSGQTKKPTVGANNLIYQMYTSGSTGRPKAVSLEHGNAIQTVSASKKLVPWKQDSRMLQYAAPSFDMCYYDTFLAWYLGICLCSASSDAVYNDLPGVINTLEATLLGLTPSVAATLEPEKVPCVEWLYCIGEAMPQTLVDMWQDKLANSYGPTEAAQMVTIFPVNRETKSAIIGAPFPNTTFQVFRKDSTTTVPILGVGELCIGGLQVARGYFANEEKTKQSFIVKDKVRLYRTGDNVRMLANGNFEFIGRTDDQVKIRGQRVELGEINAAIRDSTSDVKTVSCQILKVSDTSKEQLVAFVVPTSQVSNSEREHIERHLSSHLDAHLPSYMLPKMYCFVDAIPLSPSGKVDKKALQKRMREISISQSSAKDDAKDSSLTSTEVALREAFATSAKIEPSEVGRDVSIYHLGLDSISAIQIATKLRQQGYALDASDILHHPTIRELGKVLDGHATQDSNVSHDQPDFDFAAFDDKYRSTILRHNEIIASDVSAVRPASALQSGMIAQSIHSSGAMYFNHMTYESTVDVEMKNLTRAWAAIIEKYEILRSGFSHVEDAKHPLAMITYATTDAKMHVEVQPDESVDVASWREEVVREAMKALHKPPWKVLIQPGKLHLSAHHALYDAQVLDLLLRDLELACKGTELSASPSFNPQLSASLVGSADNGPSADFWKSIGETTFVTRFPVLTPLKVESSAFDAVKVTCQRGRQQLEKGCRHHGITMQVAGQAAWGRLLAAYTGEAEVTFGTVLSGRTTAESDEIGFPCITTIPTPAHAGETKAKLLDSLMTYNANIQRHQFVPLKSIERLTGHSNEALFDTLFTYQKRSSESTEKSMFQFLSNDLTIDYPLSVEVEPVGQDGLEISLYHRLDKVPVEHAKLIIDQFEQLLYDILDERTKWDYANVEDADSRLYSITAPEFPSLDHEAKLLHEFVEISARNSPEKPALEFVYDIAESGEVERKSWSYRELLSESNKIANLLSKQGAHPGSVVAICFDKCPEAAFTMLAISRLGCSFLALDAGAPLERKKFIMEDSEAAALVTKGAVTSGLGSQTDAPIIQLDEIDMSSISAEPPKLDRAIDPQELSYCLYTSGTTGTPKGCAITHENVVQAFLSFHKLYRWNDHSRWLQFASYHFDVSVMEHFWSWSVGMTVVVASRDLVFADLPGTIKKLDITHTDLTPSLARLLDPEDVPSLASGVFVTGGEMLRQEMIDNFGPHGAIHNAYGPTEATIGCTMYPGVPKDGRPSNIGWHFPVAGSFIVDPRNPSIPVLRGAVGEFVVSGKLVAQGYIGRPDLTKERFITLDGQRCYRTGDLVRILHNNTFDFVGRADDQVKLRGQRLEIGEINSVIKARDRSVKDVATQVLKHPKQQKDQLITFVVVPTSNSTKSSSSEIIADNAPLDLLFDLKRACQEKLPQYMIPTHILPVNKLPLSANNKADAKQLKALYENTSLETLQALSRQGESDNKDESSSGEQQKIQEVLSRMLDIPGDQISANVSFFELGLDSISVIGFAKSLRNDGLSNVSTAVIMENSTLARLAQALHSGSSVDQSPSVNASKQKILACQHRYKREAAATLSISQEAIESLAPCTPLQQGIISRALNSDNTMYFGAFHFELKPEVDVQKLRKAFQAVMDKVQILRTKFVSTDDGHIQVVLRELELPWHEANVPASEQDSHLEGQFDKWRSRNGDLISKPIEIQITETDGVRLLSLHIFHACYDGNSLPLLVQALLGEYHHSADVEYGPGYHEVLPYGPLREVKDAKSFWLKHLKPITDIEERRFQPISERPSSQPLSISTTIEPITGLEDCRRKLNVTHQALLQACWGAVLQDAASMPLVQGLVVSGRSIDYEGADRTVGPLFNTIPFLLQITRKDSWQDLVQRCHEFNSGALPLQHTSLRDIQKWISSYRRYADAPLLKTLFVFQKEIEVPSQPAIWDLKGDHFEADFPLALEIEQTLDGAFNLTLVTQSGISDEQSSHALLQKLTDVLRAAVSDSKAAVSNSVEVHELIVSKADIENVQNQLETNGHTNGHSNGKTNGHSNGNGHANDHATSEFEWTAQKLRVRDEIAGLAGIDGSNLSPQTSILELGLDSVDAVKLSSRLKRAAKIQLSVSAIMKALSIGAIAELGSEQGPPSPKEAGSDKYEQLISELAKYADKTGLKSQNADAVMPSTPLQEGMIAEMVSSELRTYFNHDVVKLRPEVDVEGLKGAWQQVVAGSPILRTRFVEVDDPDVDCTLAQVVQSKYDLSWKETTINGKEDFDEILENIRQEVLAELSELPPLRLSLLRTIDSKDVYLVLSLSHAMYDGWSLALIHADVNEAYHGSLQPRPKYEPALRKIIDAVGPNTQKYWQETLQDTTPSVLPPRNGIEAEQSATHRAELCCDEDAAVIQRFCKKQKTTLAAFSQTIWSFVLASRLKQLDVAFATVLSGRDDEDANDVLFPTMNTVIARTVLHGSSVEMMHYIQNNLSAVSQFQHYPLRKALAIAKGHYEGELVNSLFIFQRRPDEADTNSQALYESVSGSADEGIPIAVEAEVAGGALTWRIAAKDTHMSQEMTESLLQDLKATTARVLDSPHADAVTFHGGNIEVCGLPSFEDSARPEKGRKDQASSEEEESEGDWTEAELKVQNIVALVARLDKSEVQRKSSLLSLGLDSISAIKVSSLLRKEGLKLSVNELLKAETVARIAKQADTGRESSAASATKKTAGDSHDNKRIVEEAVKPFIDGALKKTGLSRDDVVEISPATSSQMLMLSKWQTEGLYLPTLEFDVHGKTSVESVSAAWASLLKFTPILRTIFTSTGDENLPILQLVLKHAQPAIQLPEKEAFDDRIASFAQGGETSPIPAALFLRPNSDGGVEARIRLSHALYDGYSIKVVFERLQSLLEADSQQHISATRSSAIYHDYLGGTLLARDDRQQFWTEYLSKLQQKALPRLKKDSVKRYHIVKPDTILNVPVLHTFVRKEGLTVQSIFLAAYAQTYAKLADAGEADDIVLGAYVANRNFEAADELDAPTLGFVPLRIKEARKRSIIDLAQQLQKDLRNIAGYSRGSVTMRELSKWLGPTFAIDTWVNLILEDDYAQIESESTTISFGEDRSAKDEEHEITANETDNAHGLYLADNKIRELYQESIDIDGTISAKSMDIGILARDGLADSQRIKHIIDEISVALGNLTK